MNGALMNASSRIAIAAGFAAGAVLARYLVGRSLSDRHAPASSGDAAVDQLVGSAFDLLTTTTNRTDEHVYVGGTASLAAAFQAVDVVRQVLATLEQQYVVVSLLRDMIDRGLSVAIGVHSAGGRESCGCGYQPVSRAGRSSTRQG